MKSEEWVGRRIGSLTIEAFEGLSRYSVGKAAYFRFRCDCGNAFSAQKSNVVGRKTDCGCSRPAPKGVRKPGSSRHPLYKVWSHMLDRCFNPNNKSFKDYGGRGIVVCERWRFGSGAATGFELFVSDMGTRPDGWTIERVDVGPGYSPDNCKWIPKSDQTRNRRCVRLVTINGQTKIIGDWCKIHGVGYWTALRRMDRGWPPEEAVTTPPHKIPTRVA